MKIKIRKKIAVLIALVAVITILSAIILFADLDGDGLSGLTELQLGTGVFNSDSDDDGLSDGAEVNTYKTDPLMADSDRDDLLDGAEVNTYWTNPLVADTDNDNLIDGAEVNVHKTNPLEMDTDNDNLNDGSEVNIYRTNPLLLDTDNDNLSDWTEINGWSIMVDNSPQHVTADPLVIDSDGDNFSDWVEFAFENTNPCSMDTDNDNLSDWEEVAVFLTDPLIKLKIVTKDPSQMVLTLADVPFTPTYQSAYYWTMDHFSPTIREDVQYWGFEDGYVRVFAGSYRGGLGFTSCVTFRFSGVRGTKASFDYIKENLAIYLATENVIIQDVVVATSPEIGNECNVYQLSIMGGENMYYLFFRESNVFTYMGVNRNIFSIEEVYEYARIVENRIKA